MISPTYAVRIPALGSFQSELEEHTDTVKTYTEYRIDTAATRHAFSSTWSGSTWSGSTLSLGERLDFALVASGLLPVEAEPTELAEALQDLQKAPDEAREEEWPEPSALAQANAKQLLKDIYEAVPRRYKVYPTPDGEICLGAYGQGCSVLLLCDSAGEVLLLVNLPDEHYYQRYDRNETAILPDDTIYSALTTLEEGSG